MSVHVGSGQCNGDRNLGGHGRDISSWHEAAAAWHDDFGYAAAGKRHYGGAARHGFRDDQPVRFIPDGGDQRGGRATHE